jgi:hypothetical protein
MTEPTKPNWKMIFKMIIIIVGILDLILIILISLTAYKNMDCTDDCCHPNHCPYNRACVVKQDNMQCINPMNNLSYMEEIEKGIKERDWDLKEG